MEDYTDIEKRYNIPERVDVLVNRFYTPENALKNVAKDLEEMENSWSMYSSDCLGHGITCLRLLKVRLEGLTALGGLNKTQNSLIMEHAGDQPVFNPEYLERIAKVCHEANKSYCESIGDNSQKHWEEAEDWQRKSAMTGVAYRINHPELGYDSLHNSWMEDKISDGWVYGDVKDAEKKTHPCIVPFNELPITQQLKDKLFASIVDSLTGRVDKSSTAELELGYKVGDVVFLKSGSPEMCVKSIDTENKFLSEETYTSVIVNYFDDNENLQTEEFDARQLVNTDEFEDM